MKRIILFALLTISISALQAQVFLNSDTIVTPIANLDDAVGYNMISSLNAGSTNLRWTRKVIEMTEGWTSAICDKNGCYFPTVDSNELSLASGETSNLDLHLYTNNIFEGYALVEIIIEDLNNPNFSITGVFIYTSQAPSSSENIERVDIKLFPNPSHGLINIQSASTNIENVQIYNSIGQLQMHQKLDNSSIDISHLPTGNYYMRAIDNSNNILATKLISKSE